MLRWRRFGNILGRGGKRILFWLSGIEMFVRVYVEVFSSRLCIEEGVWIRGYRGYEVIDRISYRGEFIKRN